MKKPNPIQQIAQNVNWLNEYQGGCSVTHSYHWSVNEHHKTRRRYWFFVENFGFAHILYMQKSESIDLTNSLN